MPPLRDESSGAEPASHGVVDRNRAAETVPQAPAIPDYELLRRIGRGSYGEVWLARGVTGVLRAVKIVWRERFADAAPFEREFRGLKEFAAISLEEPVQLALLHAGQNAAAGFFYSVMELADDAEHGRTIAPATYVPLTLAELRARRGRLPAEECVRIGVELARALAALHRHGLVHRDIKPSNVILVGGRPKLADIGLVAPAADARTFIGTEGFVPPEGPGTPAADVYAFGKLLYELATGLDRADFPRLPPAVAGLPDAPMLFRLNAVILRSCAPNPRDRYADVTELLAGLLALPGGAAPPRRWGRVLAGAAVALPLAAAIGWGWLAGRAFLPQDGASAAERSIAVLPMASLSPDPDDGLFADGVHEDLINCLMLIRDLRVVSRTSVMAYRETAKPAAVIARELGVRYLLESTARRNGSRLRVTCKLIDAPVDRPICSETYDREIGDVFAVQEQLARAIADALSAVVLPETQALLARRPTASLEAYHAFVEGRALAERPGYLLKAEPLLRTSVERDPGFAAAWCELVKVHAYVFASEIDLTAARVAKADQALGHARQLAAGTPDVIRATGIHRLSVQRDYAGARRDFERLGALQPNDGSVYFHLGAIDWQQGDFARAIANHRKATLLDPAHPRFAKRLVVDYYCLRRWPEVLAEQWRIAALHPGVLGEGRPWLAGPLGDQTRLAMTEARMSGNAAPFEALVARVPVAQHNVPALLCARLEIARARRDFVEFKRLDEQLLAAGEAPVLEPYNSHRKLAMAAEYLAFGDRAAAVARLGPLPDELRAAVARDPAELGSWRVLALVEAMLGGADAARAALARGCGDSSLTPEQKVLSGRWGAVVHAWLGEKDIAVAELTRVINHPHAQLCGYELRNLAIFLPLRGHPGFEALANDPKNDAPLL